MKKLCSVILFLFLIILVVKICVYKKPESKEFFCDEEPIVLNLEERNVYFYCIDDQFSVNISGNSITIKEFLLSNEDALFLLEKNLHREEGPSDGGTHIYKSVKGSKFTSKEITYIRCNQLGGSSTDIYIGPIELTYQANFCE